jgi:diaminopimelate decarboxylase
MIGRMTAGHDATRAIVSDAVTLAAIARAAGTPVHVLDAETIAERYAALDRAIGDYPHRLHYAIKANATVGVARLLRELGARADANSGGEIAVALRAGFAPEAIVFSGVGKTPAELERAVRLGVGAINAESGGEIDRIDAIAGRLGTQARVALRVNPDVDAGSHPHISTGLQATKFGVAVDGARAILRAAARRPHLRVVGLHVHVGSQITDPGPFARAAEAVAALAHDLRADGIVLEHLDLGGGLGIPYRPGDRAVPVAEYAAALLRVVAPTGLMLVLEPGRWIVGPAGALVTEVIDLKRKPGGGWFVVVDAGMTELLRPALYGAWHAIEALSPRPGPGIRADVVGPVCETSDTLGADRELPPLEVGDLLVIRDTGAYGAAMASNYNRRPIAAEVLVEGASWRVVRRRQTEDEMLQWDV